MGLENLAATALDLINRFGKTVSFNRITNVSYSVATGRAEGSESVSTPMAIVSDYKGRELNNEGIQTGDKKLLVAASGFTKPNMGDEFEVDDETYSVVGPVQTIYASSVPAVYVIQGRKA